MLLALLAYTPDDGKLGYTPYYYKMDVPVRVRNSISYGRAWQLLRSRGEGSNASGACDPPQLSSSCNCSTTAALPPNPGLRDTDDTSAMPRCVPSPLCSAAAPASVPAAPAAAILLNLDVQSQNMRFPVGTCAACLRRGYGKAVREVIRLLLSLTVVNTTLPVHILASGERWQQVEARLLASFPFASVVGGTVPPVVVPTWASKWARGSFSKLRALALTQYTRLVVLDNDDVVLRNIDHLASRDMPVPAFVFGWKCYPRRELRASTIIVAPSLADWQRARELLSSESTAVYDDLGEQSVWRRLYRSVYELPAGYAALRTADLPAAEWSKVRRGESREEWRREERGEETPSGTRSPLLVEGEYRPRRALDPRRVAGRLACCRDGRDCPRDRQGRDAPLQRALCRALCRPAQPQAKEGGRAPQDTRPTARQAPESKRRAIANRRIKRLACVRAVWGVGG